MSKVVILGDGLLGSELTKQTRWDCLSRRKDGIEVINFDKWVDKLIPYSTIINCIANTDTYSQDKDSHYLVNFKFVTWLVNFCNEYGKKLIHISTEFVYANNTSPPTEDDLPQPDNTWYAYTKLLADEYIKIKSKHFLICRELHKPFPFTYPEVWDVQTTGDTVDKIADLVIKLTRKDACGVFNVGTGGKKLIQLNPKSIVISPPNHIPKDTRMNLDKLNNFL